jgi:XTP/dITP diphosphohydrolase
MPPSIELLSLFDINFHDEIEETESTIEGNALLKARAIYTKTQLNCFADDSGLLIDALNGEPGVYSARYAGEPKNDEANLQKVLHQLSGVENRKAHFKTVMALIIDGKEFLCEGVINGSIISTKKGSNGFGYDPIFVPDGYSKTFAELDFKEKSTISHRALALNKMISTLNNLD